MYKDSNDLPPVGPNRWLMIFLVLGAVAIIYYFVLLPMKQRSAKVSAAVGQTLSALELEPLVVAKESWTKERLQGKVALVNFWGTWCPPCRAEFPELAELIGQLSDSEGFVPLLVSSSGGDDRDVDALRDVTENFLRSDYPALPIYADPQGVTRRAFMRASKEEPLAFPTTLVVDQQGEIRGVWTGYHPGATRDMGELVLRVLSEKSTGKTKSLVDPLQEPTLEESGAH